jgi:TolB protein
MKWCCLLLALLTAAGAAQAQTDVWPYPVIKQERRRCRCGCRTSRATAATSRARSASEQIVLQDLQFTGLFDIQRDEPEPAGMKPGTNAVVVRGKVLADANGASFEGTVTDTRVQRFHGREEISRNDSEIRKVGHHFADEVVRLVTGNQGMASTSLVYTRKVGDKWELVISDYDGYNPRPLIRQAVPLLSPRWMDGNRAVVYTTFRDGKADLWLRYVDQAKSIPIATIPGHQHRSGLVAEDRDVARRTLEGRQHRDLFTQQGGQVQNQLTHNRAIDTSPSWSPSGGNVAFLSDRSGTPQLYVMDRDGGNVRRLTFTGAYNASPAWSPRGDLIAFSTRMGAEFQLATITPDGRDGRLITKDATSYEDARWGADGRHLVCTARGRDETVSVVDIVTGGRRILAQGSDPDWSSP